jgi:hypothetical protein
MRTASDQPPRLTVLKLIAGSSFMTLDELEREYVPLRQQALAVRSYL